MRAGQAGDPCNGTWTDGHPLLCGRTSQQGGFASGPVQSLGRAGCGSLFRKPAILGLPACRSLRYVIRMQQPIRLDR